MDWLVLIGNVTVWSAAVFILLAIAGFVYQTIGQNLCNSLPPGELVSVSGRSMHLLCLGKQSGPTVILEAGGSNSSITSRKIQSQISKFVRVCAYDRAGYGFSDPVDSGRTFDAMSRDLDELLTNAKIPHPYIFVGESMGGLMVRNYCRLYPEKIAGVLLLDAAEEEHTFARLDKLQKMQSSAAATASFARVGLVRLILKLVPEKLGIPSTISAERRSEIVAEYSRPSFFHSTVRELEAYFSTPAEMRKAGGFGALGSTPLVVVTHGKPLKGSQAFLEEGWHDAQLRLTALSSDSNLVVAEQSGHAISLDQPELVVDLTRGLVERTLTL